MDAIKATFVFDGRQYDVAAISGDGLQVVCAEGFGDETIRRLSQGGFEFVLLDPATGNEVGLVGELVRSEPNVAGGPIGRIWVATKAKHEVRPDRPDAVPEQGVGPGDAISLGVRRGRARKTIAVGGGKGGVGKTLVAVNLAVALSRLQKSVTLLDGDLSNCNCNTLVGITKVERSLEEYLRKECSLDAVTVPTSYPGLRLVCGAQNNVTALLAGEMPRLLNDIRLIDADYLVIDLGAGVGDETLDLYRLADEKIVIITPQVTSLQNAYGFVKSAFFHDLKRAGSLAAFLNQAGSDAQKLHALIGGLVNGHPARQAFAGVLSRQRFQIVANMVNDSQDLKIIHNFQKVVGQYLRIDNTILGAIAASDDVRNSINRITPFVALSPEAPHSQEMARIAAQLQPRQGNLE